MIYMSGRALLVTMFLVATFDAVAQEEMEYTTFHYDNGILSSEGFMQDEKPNGYWKTYYTSGELKTEGNRKNFQLDSTWVFYGEEGNKVSEMHYTEGVRDGLQKSYQNGYLYEESNYCAGIKCGEWLYYYPTGEVQRKVPYVDGEQNGDGFEYDVDGRIITLLNYRESNLRRADKINRFDNQGNKRGPWVYYHPNGVVSQEGYYMNDKKNGIFKTYDKRGDLLTIEKYRDDELITDSEDAVILDLRNTYFRDGGVKSSGGYVDGNKEGTHRVYDKSGEVVGGEIYRKGVKVGDGIVDATGGFEGEWTIYYESGKVKAEGLYEKSERTGEWVFYHENGTVEHRGKYLKGLPQGAWKWYYDDGSLRREEFYRRGKEDGMVIEYDIEGKVITQGEFANGLREGEWFYHVGDHTEKGPYLDGERHGKWEYFYEDGNKNFEGRYTAGLAVGKHIWYYPNEQVKMEGKYSSGVRVGTWKKYDEIGIQVLTIKYKNGREFKINGKRVEYGDGEPYDLETES